MENIISNKQTVIEIKSVNHRKSGHVVTVPIETAAFFLFTSSVVVSNLSNYIEKEPKQQLIEYAQGKDGVSMVNEKHTSIQEVRQQDIDNIKELIKEQIKTVNANINTTSVTENLHYKKLNSDVQDVKKSIDSIKKEAVDYAKQISDEQIAKSSYKAVIISAIIGAIGTILTAIIGKLF